MVLAHMNYRCIVCILFACRYYWPNYFLKAQAWARPNPNSSLEVRWARPGLGGLWARPSTPLNQTTISDTDESWSTSIMGHLWTWGPSIFQSRSDPRKVNAFSNYGTSITEDILKSIISIYHNEHLVIGRLLYRKTNRGSYLMNNGTPITVSSSICHRILELIASI